MHTGGCLNHHGAILAHDQFHMHRTVRDVERIGGTLGVVAQGVADRPVKGQHEGEFFNEVAPGNVQLITANITTNR
ncbi:hypothetical protein D3C85_1504910 [compost metagenome]